MMAVDLRSTVAGKVLDHGQHAALEQAFAGGPAEPRDLRWIMRVGAIADHGISSRLRHVEYGQAIDGDAESREVVRDQARDETHGLARALSAESAQRRGRGIAAPMRRLQARHAPAFLVD